MQRHPFVVGVQLRIRIGCLDLPKGVQKPTPEVADTGKPLSELFMQGSP
jgi:hypothetical protein